MKKYVEQKTGEAQESGRDNRPITVVRLTRQSVKHDIPFARTAITISQFRKNCETS